MNQETDTPETNAAIELCSDPNGAVELCDLCQKLERERDQARREAESASETIRQILSLLDEGKPIDKPWLLAEIIRKRHDLE